jgi:hypothetical protein
MIDWMLEHWFIEAICIIFLSFIVGLIVGKAIACVNGED